MPRREPPLPGLEDRRYGYRAPAASRVAGITYRQLDYWDTTELVKPSISRAVGSGTQRLYALDDIVLLRVVKRLLDAGLSLQRVRPLLAEIRDRGLRLRDLTIASDGEQVYSIGDARDLIGILRSGRGLFAIAVDQVYADTERDVAALPVEPADPFAMRD